MADVPNSLDNTYYSKSNHIRLSKNESTKEEVLDAAVTRAAGLGITIQLGARITPP